MNRRQAKRAACRLASQLIDQAINAGGWNDDTNCVPLYNDEDRARVARGLDELAQELLERGER